MPNDIICLQVIRMQRCREFEQRRTRSDVDCCFNISPARTIRKRNGMLLEIARRRCARTQEIAHRCNYAIRCIRLRVVLKLARQ